MRLACLQFSPQLGKPSSNIERANAILEASDPQDLDLLVLPELAFAGYNHPSFSAIFPYLEPTCRGISTDWAKRTAAHLNCIVTVSSLLDTSAFIDSGLVHLWLCQIGYAELYTQSDNATPSDDCRHETESVVAYNSTVTVSSTGNVLAHYRKTHLYVTDESWAQPSPQGWLSTPITFASQTQAERMAIATFGICMDLNPHKFQAPWTEYEFATHAFASRSEIVIVSMAWLSSCTSIVSAEMNEEPELDTMDYWIERLRPLAMAEKEVLVVCANRCGEESGKNSMFPDTAKSVQYAGTSWIGMLGKHRVRVGGILGRGDEDVLVVDTAKDPKWILRPASPNPATDV